MTPVFELPIRVYIEDTDAGGIVYYANYLKFLERARTECFRQLGFAKAAMVDENTMLVVHEVNAKYHQVAELDDRLLVSCQFSKVKRASVVVQQSVRRGDATLLSATVHLACVRRGTLVPTKIPAAVRTAMLACENL